MKIELPRTAGDVNEFKSHGRTLEVTKLRRDYFAKIVGDLQGRFGDAEQIREDIQYFLDGGGLPRGRGF